MVNINLLMQKERNKKRKEQEKKRKERNAKIRKEMKLKIKKITEEGWMKLFDMDEFKKSTGMKKVQKLQRTQSRKSQRGLK